MTAISDLLTEAEEALQAGDPERARRLLTEALKADPKQARAWLSLSACWSEPEKKRYCLEKALALQPDDPQIGQALSNLTLQDQVIARDTQPLPSLQANDAAQATLPPSGQSRAAGKPGSMRAQPARQKKQPASRSGNCAAQGGLLLLLALLALASIAILTLVLLQTDVPLFALGQPASQLNNHPVEVPTFQLPSTWTPTPELIASPSPSMIRPALTLPTTPSPAPSITPFFALWRIVIGQTVQERPIIVYRFGTGKNERLIVAGIHGGAEANTIALADQLTEYLQKRPDLIPTEVTLYILRSLNPDGEALGDKPEGRFNAKGVDLNRNFEKNWKSSWKSQGCVSSDPKTAGPSPASEPETQAFKKFLLGRKIEVLINYHSAGLGIFPARSPANSASVKLAQAIAAISPYAYPPVKTQCEYTGTLVDWATSQGVQAAVDLELNSSKNSEFEENLKILDLLLSWQP